MQTGAPLEVAIEDAGVPALAILRMQTLQLLGVVHHEYFVKGAHAWCVIVLLKPFKVVIMFPLQEFI